MGSTVIYCVLLIIIPADRVLIRGQGAIGGGNGSDCCRSVAVNEGIVAGLDGYYTLMENQGSKPEDVCINGCVYTKYGAPASDKYCFRQDDVKRANVMCPANTTPYEKTQPKTAGPTTPAGTQGTTTDGPTPEGTTQPKTTTAVVNEPGRGGWSTWGAWSSCDPNTGKKNRDRSCNSPPPSNGGAQCTGDSQDVADCPVDGGWGNWSGWGECDWGETVRHRQCDSPAPKNGGALCTGSNNYEYDIEYDYENC